MRPECVSYNILGEEDRRASNKKFLKIHENYCDDSSGRSYTSLDWKGPGWYRFQHPAGKILSQSFQGRSNCGTAANGWSNSTLPDTLGESVDIKICFDSSNDDCYWSNKGKVTNCGSYFVYYLDKTPGCSFRYCGSN